MKLQTLVHFSFAIAQLTSNSTAINSIETSSTSSTPLQATTTKMPSSTIEIESNLDSKTGQISSTISTATEIFTSFETSFPPIEEPILPTAVIAPYPYPPGNGGNSSTEPQSVGAILFGVIVVGVSLLIAFGILYLYRAYRLRKLRESQYFQIYKRTESDYNAGDAFGLLQDSNSPVGVLTPKDSELNLQEFESSGYFGSIRKLDIWNNVENGELLSSSLTSPVSNDLSTQRDESNSENLSIYHSIDRSTNRSLNRRKYQPGNLVIGPNGSVYEVNDDGYAYFLTPPRRNKSSNTLPTAASSGYSYNSKPPTRKQSTITLLTEALEFNSQNSHDNSHLTFFEPPNID